MTAGSAGTAAGVSVRKTRALETRRRVVTGAYRLFCQQGYPATTMKDIAVESGVAVQTLYYTFRTKGAILGEALGAAVVGFDVWNDPPVPPPDDGAALTGLLGWYDEFLAAPDAHQALTLFVEKGTAVLSRVGPLLAAMNAAASDPDAAAVIRLAERRRIDSYREVVKSLARRGALRADLGEARATDLLLVLFSADLYHALTSGRGWTPSETARMFLDTLELHLLEPS